MWAYGWLVRRHLSPPWEDEDGFRGEVRARYEIKNVSAFCVFVFVLPLARCCCCLWTMEILVLLLHCLLTRTSFFFSFHPFLQEGHDHQDNIQRQG